MWGADGVVVCSNAGATTSGTNCVSMCSDGAASATVTWDDTRSAL